MKDPEERGWVGGGGEGGKGRSSSCKRKRIPDRDGVGGKGKTRWKVEIIKGQLSCANAMRDAWMPAQREGKRARSKSVVKEDMKGQDAYAHISIKGSEGMPKCDVVGDCDELLIMSGFRIEEALVRRNYVGTIAIHSGLHEDVEDICRKFKNDNTCSLTSLSLRKVQICSASLIAEVLGTNTSLLMLDLSRHRMGSIGATQLCDALASNTTLQTLELSGNPVPFADTWRTMIATRSGILRLAEPGAAAVAGLLSRNRTLTSIGLAHNVCGRRWRVRCLMKSAGTRRRRRQDLG
eukprot:249296-Hanusia_phi.AAC.6